ncbi:SDR family oxidoreductase, partial [Candidatus Poribacteria bacterium]|nr:SDR family oxidoreductase [Candidatus Poribacteria bacterium]
MDKRRYLITGGRHGIGESLVRLLSQFENDVVFTGRNEERLRRVAAETGAHALRADVSSPEDNKRTVDFGLETMGGIDVLVNNAAYGYGAAIGEMDVDAMKRMFDTNVFGLVDLT